jgi:hypothetical protein
MSLQTTNGMAIDDTSAAPNGPGLVQQLGNQVDAFYGSNVASAANLPASGKFAGQSVWLVDVKGWGVWDGSKWVTDTAWITAPLAFDATSYRAPQYRRWNGKTEVRGVIKNAAATTGVIFTLPATFRPGGTGSTGTEQFITISGASGSARIDVSPSGAATVIAYGTNGSGTSVSLTGITFAAEQ